jgi:hypothetical protein
LAAVEARGVKIFIIFSLIFQKGGVFSALGRAAIFSLDFPPARVMHVEPVRGVEATFFLDFPPTRVILENRRGLYPRGRIMCEGRSKPVIEKQLYGALNPYSPTEVGESLADVQRVFP